MTKITYGNPSESTLFDEFGVDVVEKVPTELSELYNQYLTEDTMYDVNEGDTINGSIVSIKGDEISIDFNSKEFAYISISKDKLNVDDYSVGDDIEALVMKCEPNSEIIASISEKSNRDLYEFMIDPKNLDTVYDAKVIELTNNGYKLDINGLTVFMPGSLGGVNKLVDFSELLGKTIKVKSIKNNNRHSKHSKSLIVSHKDYLKDLIKDEIDNLTIGESYDGVVTGTYSKKWDGVFVQFNEVLTGLIHRDEFDDTLSEHFDNGDIKPGVEIAFYLKEIVNTERIILSRHPITENYQDVEDIQEGQTVSGKVVSVAKFGYFIKFGKQVGLLHISKVDDEYKKGDQLDCVINKITKGKFDLSLA